MMLHALYGRGASQTIGPGLTEAGLRRDLAVIGAQRYSMRVPVKVCLSKKQQTFGVAGGSCCSCPLWSSETRPGDLFREARVSTLFSILSSPVEIAHDQVIARYSMAKVPFLRLFQRSFLAPIRRPPSYLLVTRARCC